MNLADIARQRLVNQHLAGPPLDTPQAVVTSLGAVQAQDFAGSKWALGLRLRNFTDAQVEQAFAEGAILRTHALRPTWHYLAPADIRWILALTSARVHALNALQYRRAGLDEAAAKRSATVLSQALKGHNYLTRDQLRPLFEKAGVATAGEFTASYILMRAELDGLVCSGPRHGKQFTYALLEERVPPTPVLPLDEALVELVRRYFTSHGPATPHDFAWWSGLTVADARRGLDLLGNVFEHATIEGTTYWFAPAKVVTKMTKTVAHLLPNYDEFGSHKDHRAILDPAHAAKLAFDNLIELDGQVIGTWRRTLKKTAVHIETRYLEPPSTATQNAVAQAAQQFGAFLGLDAVLV